MNMHIFISVINECESDPCSNGATCVDTQRGYHCVCPAGFTGPDCDIDIDECFGNNVCLNNATCVDMENDFECHCQVGFEGENCEINIDDCVEGTWAPIMLSSHNNASIGMDWKSLHLQRLFFLDDNYM